MSSINSRVPPLRLAAVDTPSDGEVAAYQSSSGQFEWVANGSGGGGTVTSVALTETGSALTITGSPITGAGTINIAGAGTSSQVILGDLSLGALTSGTVTSVSSSQAFITITNPTTTPSISIGNASSTATGVLTSTDWNTFNNKGSGTVTSVSGTSPISSSGGTTPTISLDASGVVAGSYTYTALTVDATGRITAASTGSAPSIDGVGAATQVGIWADSDTILGDADLTFDGSNLSVGGYVESGTGKFTTDSGTTDLTLDTNDGAGSSGSIVIEAGGNGQISINPHGTGTVKIDGVEIDNTAIATGYVLKATSTTAAGWAAESGGSITFPIEADSGSAGAPSYSFSADTDTGMYLAGASNIGIVAAGNSYLSIGSLGAVQFDRKALFNVATEAAPNAFATDTNTGFFQAAADTISLSNAGSETFRFGSSGEILVGGTAAGTSGQVLTSGGSGAAVSWTTVSGGGASLNQALNPQGTIFSSYNIINLARGVGHAVVGRASSTEQVRTGYRKISCRPFIAPQTGNVTAFVAVVSTSSADTDFEVGIYEDSNGVPGNKMGTATIDCSSTGQKTQTTISSTISLTAGTQYWYTWVTTNSIGSPGLRAETKDNCSYITGQTNALSGTDFSIYFAATSETDNTSPSSITASGLVGSGNSGGAARIAIKY